MCPVYPEILPVTNGFYVNQSDAGGIIKCLINLLAVSIPMACHYTGGCDQISPVATTPAYYFVNSLQLAAQKYNPGNCRCGTKLGKSCCTVYVDDQPAECIAASETWQVSLEENYIQWS